MTTFTYQGTTFTLRPKTGRDAYLYDTLLYDVQMALCKARGIDPKAMPLSLSSMAIKFVQWMQVTTITGDLLPFTSLRDVDYAKAFDAWDTVLANDLTGELWQLWDDAYKAVNLSGDAPLVAS